MEVRSLTPMWSYPASSSRRSICLETKLLLMSATPTAPWSSLHASRSNGPGQKAISLTAPASDSGFDDVKHVTRPSSNSLKALVLKMEMTPYCVPTARYLPVLEKQAAKLPRLSDS